LSSSGLAWLPKKGGPKIPPVLAKDTFENQPQLLQPIRQQLQWAVVCLLIQRRNQYVVQIAENTLQAGKDLIYNTLESLAAVSKTNILIYSKNKPKEVMIAILLM
jgi:hypothetical protein